MFVVGSLSRFGSIADWASRITACMGGCFGRENSPPPISSLHEALNSQNNNNNNARKTSKSTVSEDFWTTSTVEMDTNNNALQSCGSISSTSTLTQAHDSLGKQPEFVNQGVIQWNQSRMKWIGNKKPHNRPQQHHEPSLSWDATYDSLLSNNKPFSKPIPLAEMVDFLVDIWEQEGMYD